jgi:hypothetical protein
MSDIVTTPSGESASDHESDPEAMPWGRVRLALISGHALDGMARLFGVNRRHALPRAFSLIREKSSRR